MPDTHAVLTGPIRGTVTLADGTVVDVKPHVIYVDTPEQSGEIAHLISLRYEVEGHPLHDEDNPFIHHCTRRCGKHARALSHPMAAMAAVRAQQQTDAIPDADTRAHHAEALGTGAGGPSMALASVTAENAAANGLDGTGTTNVIPDVSLHVATPGTTGASENANAGGYARQACSYNGASGGSKTNSSTMTWSTLGTIAVTHFGTQSSATYGAGNFAVGGALLSNVTATTITAAGGALAFAVA